MNSTGGQEASEGHPGEPERSQERSKRSQEAPKRSQKAVFVAIFGVIKRQKSAKMDLRATLVETRTKNKGTKTQTLKSHKFLKVYWREGGVVSIRGSW